jgi:hypothetical protein
MNPNSEEAIGEPVSITLEKPIYKLITFVTAQFRSIHYPRGRVRR